ncbi:hypothetical protein [Aurantimonas coralicida]|uniref:hypothetical protein n=1 Tax=Aurantimonas coralicida TaxID=182270 RepID=UPI001D17D7C7|nr:hypothetical protein [Aurantimonas coralicida]MCC4296268.1 hypothetical protein [Aurantimonas coralicida]
MNELHDAVFGGVSAMKESGKTKLVSLLFNGDREIENFKFFPGTDRGLTADRMCDAAADAISGALDGGLVDAPPVSGRERLTLSNFQVA